MNYFGKRKYDSNRAKLKAAVATAIAMAAVMAGIRDSSKINEKRFDF